MREQLRAVFQASEDGSGRFRAIATRKGSLIEASGGLRRFAEGAFRETLKQRAVHPLLLQHADERVIGKAVFSEGPEGLMVEGELVLDVKDAAETYALMKAGALTDVSIGFKIDKKRLTQEGDNAVTVVEQATLAECSVVTWGADKAAKIVTVHAADEAMAETMEALQALAAAANPETHEGKVFSQANLSKLHEALSSLVDLVGKVDPGHIAQLGRRAARMMKKSLVLMPGKAYRKAQRDAQLRNLEMQAMGVGELPLLPEAMPAYEPDPDYGLLNALQAICNLPEGARRALFVEAVKQYLARVGDAEAVDPDGDEASAASAPQEEGS